jgi:hypothetical protein
MSKDVHIVTEQGVFGGLDIEDPSKKKVKTKSELDQEIEDAITRNKQNL